MVLLLTACQQNKQDAIQTDQQKQMQVTEMMQDSVMVNAVMEHIASNSDTRMEMMQKMVEYCNSDSAEMIQMFNAMTEDKEMHAMMMKMMGGGMMIDSDMVQHDMAQKK
jgi:hypothetical protein